MSEEYQDGKSMVDKLSNKEVKTRLAAITDCLRKYKVDNKDAAASGSTAVSFDEAGIYKPHANYELRPAEGNVTFADKIRKHGEISEPVRAVSMPIPEKECMEQAEMAAPYTSEVGIFYEELGEEGISEEFRAGTYGHDDMAFISQYAVELKRQMEDACHVWSIGKPDRELGKALAEEKLYIQGLAGSAGIGSKAEELVNRVFLPYIEKFMDALDKEIENNRKKEYSWLFRTTDIDRDAVYSSYQSALQDS